MNCPICDTEVEDSPAFVIQRYDESLVSIALCDACKHGFVVDRARESKDIRHLYDEFYHEAKVSPPRQKLSSSVLRRLILRKQGPKGRMLDVGCNTGSVLLAMSDTEWELDGVEAAPQAASMAREYTRATIHEELLEDVDLPARSFNAILMQAVIEHIREPLGAFEKIAQLMAPDGLLLLMTGDRTSRVARQMKEKWPMHYSIGHYHFFSNASLTLALEASGFEIEFRRWGGPVSPRAWVPHARGLNGKLRFTLWPKWIAKILNSQSLPLLGVPWTRFPIGDHLWVGASPKDQRVS